MLRVKFGFSVINNIRNPVSRSINNRVTTYDSNIDRYQDLQVIAYTHKRRIAKQQVPPKIHILQNQVPEIEQILMNQIYPEHVQVMSMNMMQALYEDMKISSAYIFSKFQQKHLKQLLQAYSQKVLMNGKMPPMHSLSTYHKTAEKTIELYRTFYFGENLSKLQQLIESEYLNLKTVKYNNYMKSFEKSIKKMNQLLKCIWNLENQRSLEGYDNWQSRPVDDYGDFRPFYNDIVLSSQNPQSKQNDFLIHQLESLSNLPKQKIDFISIQIFNRLLQWCGSLQFTRVLKLPADFLIQLSIVSVHIWMIMHRLKKQKGANLLIKALQRRFQSLILTKLGQISAETGSTFHLQVYERLVLHWMAYEAHFQSKTNNKYQNIDALVHSTVLLSKTERYSDTVIIMSEYLIKNYDKTSKLSIDQILKGNIQFDVYLVDPDYKTKFTESSQVYSFEDRLKIIHQPLTKPTLQLQNKSLSTKVFRIMNILVKGLKSFDYYSQVEKQQKQSKALSQTGWKFQDDLDQQINTVRKLRSKHRK